MMTRSWPAALWFVRHGESEGNLADVRAHQAGASRLELDARDADVELSPTGHRQAEALGHWFSKLERGDRPTKIVSSPYARAASTAGAIAKPLGLSGDLALDERLRERDLGMFDGLTGMGIRDLFPDEAERRTRIGKFYYRPPGGESWCDVALRVRSFLTDVRDTMRNERLLLVSHQAVIANFRYVLEDLSEAALMEIDAGPPLANCSITTYRRDDHGALQLDGFNDVGPLDHMDETVTAEDANDDEA
jgi:broad specificity phosphatase PhoE